MAICTGCNVEFPALEEGGKCVVCVKRTMLSNATLKDLLVSWCLQTVHIKTDNFLRGSCNARVAALSSRIWRGHFAEDVFLTKKLLQLFMMQKRIGGI